MATGSYLSVNSLNVNGLNAPTKRQRLDEWIQKQDPYICCLQETHLKTGDTYRLKVKGWKKVFHAKRDQKKAGVAIFISDKIACCHSNLSEGYPVTHELATRFELMEEEGRHIWGAWRRQAWPEHCSAEPWAARRPTKACDCGSSCGGVTGVERSR